MFETALKIQCECFLSQQICHIVQLFILSTRWRFSQYRDFFLWKTKIHSKLDSETLKE